MNETRAGRDPNFLVRSWSPQRGGTLIEMLILSTLLSLLMGIILSVAISKMHQSQRRFTQRQLAAVGAMLPVYRVITGRACPRGVGELQRLGFMTLIPLDAWHRPLVIDCGPRPGFRPLGVRSAGPDQILYTEDDLCSYPRGFWVAKAPPWQFPWLRAGALLLLLVPLLLLRRWAAPVKTAL